MEPKRTFMKKAKIELFSNCFAGLTKQNDTKSNSIAYSFMELWLFEAQNS